MGISLSRRHLLGAAGAAALAPAALAAPAAAVPVLPPTNQLVVLPQPRRLYDSRNESSGRWSTGGVLRLGVGFGTESGIRVASAFLNVTITGTTGAGFVAVVPMVVGPMGQLTTTAPSTSNINWSTANQTLANLLVVPAGFESNVEFWFIGNGATHLIVDMQAYVGTTADLP